MKKSVIKVCFIVLAVALLSVMLYACKPYTVEAVDRYPILDDEANELNKDHTTKDEAIDITCNSMTNLLDYLDSDVVSTTGYYIGADIAINTENNDAFVLKLRANLYTYPYELKDEQGNVLYDANGDPMVDEEALAIHNELIKQNDIVLEWYDGMTNTMLIGFYFDGINPNSADPGNNLYLNLQGSKRIFPDFGDSVLYQQIVRLITQFNLASIMGSAAGGTSADAVETVRDLLEVAITTNYKKVLNNDITSIFYNDVSLSIVADDVTDYMQSFFSPFSDKIDPLTKKYLGFSFWTVGNSEITAMLSDMQYFVSPASSETLDKEILSGIVIDLSGTSRVANKAKDSMGNAYVASMQEVPFTSRIAVDYSVRTSSNIVIDKSDYTLYEYGCYEYIGELFIPYLDLKMDALIRTDIQETDNPDNDIFMQFRDQADDKLLIGLYYDAELTYIDITGLEDLYGGIKFEDIGLPKAYKDGINVAELLEWLFDTIDYYIVALVDELLAPSEGSTYDNMTKAIMDNMESTEKTDDDPTSRNTIAITVDMDLIRLVLKETSENGTEYTNEQMVDIINQEFNIDLDEIAAILGMNVEQLMETTYFKLTYDVDDYSIVFDLYSTMDLKDGEEPYLVLTLDVAPTHLGEKVKIVFPSFKNFNKLKRVYTYSGYMEGEFIFASTEEVDLSDLMGAFIGDLSGKNTEYILPDSAAIYFTMYYDQYIREQILENGRWTRSGRSAFNIYFYTIDQDTRVDLFRVYANDVAFDTSKNVDEFNYVWVDLLCVDNVPKLKIREDLFIESFNMYMGEDVTDEDPTVTGLTKIVQALLEDSWPVFEPDVIRITTSNQTIKDFFRVDELIATVSVQIGFTQRVFNIDELESSFAMYTVGEFEDMTGVSPYETELHSTIPVYFDFGSRVEVRDFKFDYDEDSIAVVNGKYYYYPEISGRFMGVTRNYQLAITGGDRGSSKIDSLTEKSVVWEPLDDMPTTAVATYGNDSAKTFAYKADYDFFGTYDSGLDMYVMQNDYGYDIMYDYKNKAYIVGLGTNFKMDKIYNVLKETDTIHLKDYTSALDTEMIYDLKSGFYGYYVIITDRCRMLYNIVTDTYVIATDSDMADAKILAGNDAKIVTYAAVFEGYNMRYEFSTGMYVVDSNEYKILYDTATKTCYIQDEYDLAVVKDFMNGKNVKVSEDIDWAQVNWGKNIFNTFDWSRTAWNSINWKYMTRDAVTLQGGKFIVRVIIGRGMMATYEELIDVKITNRVVATDKYVNVNTENGKVKAPVADSIFVDPYVYILLKADYYNNYSASARPANFVEWFFSAYNVAIPFTEIYHNEDDTPTEYGSFTWSFDYNNGMRIYSEADINNLGSPRTNDVTYVYTVFKKQVIAIAVYVQSRTIDYIQIGSEDPGTYTVDSLVESTYTIPDNPTIYFNETDGFGRPLTLNFSDLSPEASTIFKDSKWTTSANFATSGVRSSSLYARKNVIVWSDPKADNFKLNWGDEPVKPFKRTNTNVTTSFVDIRNYVDPLGTWFAEDWYNTPIVSVTVLMPNKVVESINYVDGNTFTVSNIMLQGGAENGRFYADPYDVSSWVMPSEVTVVFRDSATEEYTKTYAVDWSVIKNDDAQHTKLNNNTERLSFDGGKTTLSTVSKDHSSYYLYTQIGNDIIGYIDLVAMVTNRSGYVSRVEFLDASNNVVAGSLAKDPLVEDPDNPGSYVYTFLVDTYSRFAMPEKLRVLFDDDSVRTYSSSWGEHAPWVQGTNVVAGSLVGKADGINTTIGLMFVIEAREVTKIEILRANPSRESIAISIADKHVTVEGFVVSGDKVNLGNGTSVSPYEYLRYLFGEVRVTFATKGSGSPIMIYDVVESALYDIYRTFDTQIARLMSGEEFTIYLGQGKGADDYTLTFKAGSADQIIAGSTTFGVIEPYDIENNLAKYTDGYVIGNEIEINVEYALQGVRTFPKGSFANWVVGKPDVLPAAYSGDSDFEGLNGEIKKGDEISVISWDALLGGGYLWISTMIDDSSRVFVRLEIGGIDIGSDFDSAPSYVGKLVIKNGIITVNDVYSFYPFYESITLEAMPKTIRTSGIDIPRINWRMTIDMSNLDNVDYTTNATYELARANVMDEEIIVYLRILPCVISGVSYTDAKDGSKSFATEDDTFYFDAYVNYGYAGDFTLPKALKVNFQNGGYHNNTDTTYTTYLSTDEFVGYATIENITYNYSEHTVAGTASVHSITLRIKMPGDGQQYDFTVVFLNKTVTSIRTEDYAEAYNIASDSVTLDPYTPGAYVSSKLIISFAEGSELYRTVSWKVPVDYEVRYDTYQRILSTKLNNAYNFTSQLISQGLEPQDLSLSVFVLDRRMTAWTLDGYLDTPDGINNPNATYHYLDPFAGRASDLPVYLTDIVGGVAVGQQDLTKIKIVWDFEDSDISADGTTINREGKYGDVIRGYLGNAAYGQPISIRVYVDRWEFSAIRKPQGDGYIIMNEEIRFYFSRLTEKSAYDNYQVAFTVTDASTDKLVRTTKNVVFYPDDMTVPSTDSDGRNHILTYDANAKQKANVSSQTTGRFYLTNGAGRTIISPSQTAYYQYETLHISELDLGYGYGADNYAMYVVNPLNPVFNPDDTSNNYVSKAMARGTKNQKFDQDLGEVTVRWPTEAFSDSYIKGGIYRGYTVTLELYVGTRLVHTQEFDIMLVFLDMSPTESITITAGETAPTIATMHYRNNYTAATYMGGVVNPYRESYNADLIEALNIALENYDLVDDNEIIYTNIVWASTVPASVARDTVIYSTAFSVSTHPNIVYRTNALKLVVKPKAQG